MTGERAAIVELPYKNNATAELTALVGARVMGAHRHPLSLSVSPCLRVR